MSKKNNNDFFHLPSKETIGEFIQENQEDFNFIDVIARSEHEKVKVRGIAYFITLLLTVYVSGLMRKGGDLEKTDVDLVMEQLKRDNNFIDEMEETLGEDTLDES